MEFLAEIINRWKPFTFFVKHSILDVWQGSEYASVICYSLFVRVEDASKIDSVAVYIFILKFKHNYRILR